MRFLFVPLLTLLTAWPGVALAGQDKPDVVLLVWDATRPDHLSTHGYARDTTPNLKALADQGTVFENAYAVGPWTMPSVAGLFTGLFSHNHGVDHEAKDFSLALPEQVTTLAEAMKAEGYATGLFTAQGIYYNGEGFTQGFDQHGKVPEPKIHQRGLDFLDQAGDTPAFLVLYYLDPHSPYVPKPAHDLWAQPGDPDVNLIGCGETSGKSEQPPGSIGHCDINGGDVTLTDAQWARLQSLYDGELHQNDALLGELLAGLEQRGTKDRTAIFFTSDHGEAFDDHPDEKVWHRLPFDFVLRVPLIAYLPGTFPAGKRVSAQARTIDVFPSALEVAGATVPEVNGESLVALAKAKDPKDRVVVGASHWVNAPAFYRDGTYKLILTRKGNTPDRLYDVTKDPDERKNLAGNAGLLAKVKAAYEAFLTETTLDVGAGDKADDAELERLRALGYVD